MSAIEKRLKQLYKKYRTYSDMEPDDLEALIKEAFEYGFQCGLQDAAQFVESTDWEDSNHYAATLRRLAVIKP